MFNFSGNDFFKSFQKSSNGKASKSSLLQVTEKLRDDLLASDVDVKLVDDLIANLKSRASARNFTDKNEQAQFVLYIAKQEIKNILGDEFLGLKLPDDRLYVILVCGMQGSGKTSFCSKLAHRMIPVCGKRIMVASTDTQRPAAQLQLRSLCNKSNVDFFDASNYANQVDIAIAALNSAKGNSKRLLIIDTAGRTCAETCSMQSLMTIKNITSPDETMLVVDGLIGQDAVNVAMAFNAVVDISGIIITKIDSDVNIGSAVSIRNAIKRPIKYLSSGESVSSLTEFQPHRIANRILDIGDFDTLIESVNSVSDDDTNNIAVSKIQSGEFDFEDLLTQLNNIKKMGGIAKVATFVPGAGKLRKQNAAIENIASQQIAAILSMTLEERRNPQIINYSRKNRIANGAGVNISVINSTLDRLKFMRSMLSQVVSNTESNNHSSMNNLKCHDNYERDIPVRKSKTRHKKK